MIKFFRTIRQNLLLAGQTRKYLKYAIGEIVLVVIGILIALQINNWNNYKIDRISEVDFLNRLTHDLSTDTIAFSWTVRGLELKLESLEYLIALNKKDSTSTMQAPQ